MIRDDTTLGSNVQIPHPELVNLYAWPVGDDTADMDPLLALAGGARIDRHRRCDSGPRSGIPGAASRSARDRARSERVSRYDALFQDADVVSPMARRYCSHACHLYSVQCENRDGLREQLEGQGIMTGIHYPTPAHLQPAYRNLGYREDSFPVAEAAAPRVVSLPLFPELSLENVDRVGEAVRKRRCRRIPARP